jgi:hypothetical protein
MPESAPSPTADVLVDHDLPEPTSYRDQNIIPLRVPDDAWLTFRGLSYWLDPSPTGRSARVPSPSSHPMTIS